MGDNLHNYSIDGLFPGSGPLSPTYGWQRGRCVMFTPLLQHMISNMNNRRLQWIKWFFPTSQVRVVSFYVSLPASSSSFDPSSSSSSPHLICQLLIAVGLPGSQLPALDRSGPRRTSSASSWSQWASPDLICQLLIAVGLAQPPLPDLNRRGSERCGPRQTSLSEIRSTVDLNG